MVGRLVAFLPVSVKEYVGLAAAGRYVALLPLSVKEFVGPAAAGFLVALIPKWARPSVKLWVEVVAVALI